MYSNGKSLLAVTKLRCPEKGWSYRNDAHQSPRLHKQFVECICPKCTVAHHIYMLWTGRGVPRKYCGNCKPLVAGYDSSVHYEAAVLAPGHSKKRGRRYEGE